ncbi:MAG: orotidine-5'-phosphate decarboxylase [Anaerolineales bacterium]|nr:orotidine-5'-phosphate decarboxylase [Anaerolineales bacterium]
MSFFSRLERRVKKVDSLLCVGLDPHISDLPEATPQAMLEFSTRLIELTADVAAAFKPNSAFFEVLGEPGVAVLRQVIQAVPDDIPIILDAKRGDIASTAKAYAKAAFETFGADAITINPYLGHDAVFPFLEDAEKGVFLLCKTSNPGSKDFQDLRVQPLGSESPTTLYERVAILAHDWNKRDNLGVVVGATFPDALMKVRAIASQLWILAPGIGAQGANLSAALKAGLNTEGSGILFPVSRQISRSEDPHQAALEIRDSINLERYKIVSEKPNFQKIPFERNLLILADKLLDSGCIRFGKFKLKSGLISPIYIDLRRLVGFPGLLSQIADAYIPVLNKLKFNHLAGLPYAGLPIAIGISIQAGWSMVYPRKEVKAYGTKAEIEGVFKPGDQVVLIDDLATTGGSKFEAIDKLKSAGLLVSDVVVLIDRQSGAAEDLAKAGYNLHSVFTLSQLLNHWESKRSIPTKQIKSVRDFLSKR